MPWCPRCDEVFPEGPACPRCRAALVEVSGVTQAEEHAPVVLPHVRIPRRLRRALGPVHPPPPPPRHLIAVAVALVLVAGGFTLGRMSAVPADGTDLRTPPLVGARLDAPGSLAYVRPGRSTDEYALVRAELESGDVEVADDFTSPHPSRSTGRRDTASVSGLAGSVAVVVSSRSPARHAVAAYPARGQNLLWLAGQEAAWEDASSLLVRDGQRVVRWRLGDGPQSEALPGQWRRVVQTASGAVLEGATESGLALHLSRPDGPERVLDLPAGTSTLAVAPTGRPALVLADNAPAVWDGLALHEAKIDTTFRAKGASFSADGSRIALVVQMGDAVSRTAPQQLAILDRTGERVDLHPLPAPAAAPACLATPVWDDGGTWVFVGPGDRTLHAVEVGGRRQKVDVHDAGCGLAWSGDRG